MPSEGQVCNFSHCLNRERAERDKGIKAMKQMKEENEDKYAKEIILRCI
jgi:hypothetical protein